MIIGIPPKATKAYRKRVAAFAHEMVSMIDNIKMKERKVANNGYNVLDTIFDLDSDCNK